MALLLAEAQTPGGGILAGHYQPTRRRAGQYMVTRIVSPCIMFKLSFDRPLCGPQNYLIIASVSGD